MNRVISYFVYILLIIILTSCSAERDLPISVETVGPVFRQSESMAMDLDGKGIVNGYFLPARLAHMFSNNYPIKYTGNWEIIQNNYKESWYIAMTSEKGARVDVVGTMSRVIFDFYDHRFYSDAGTVSFWLDEKKIGEYNLARTNKTGQAIMDYMIYTNKQTLATITMKVESGRVVIVGYRLIFQ